MDDGYGIGIEREGEAERGGVRSSCDPDNERRMSEGGGVRDLCILGACGGDE